MADLDGKFPWLSTWQWVGVLIGGAVTWFVQRSAIWTNRAADREKAEAELAQGRIERDATITRMRVELDYYRLETDKWREMHEKFRTQANADIRDLRQAHEACQVDHAQLRAEFEAFRSQVSG